MGPAVTALSPSHSHCVTLGNIVLVLQDADHALAKVLQDQERAMMHLTAFRG